MHISRSAPLVKLLSLLLSYTLFIMLCAPFITRKIGAASPRNKAVPTAPPAGVVTQNSNERAQGLLIRFRPGASGQDINSLIESHGLRRVRSLRGQSGLELLDLPNNQNAEAVASDLRLNPVVELAEVNYPITGDAFDLSDRPFAKQWPFNNRNNGLLNPPALAANPFAMTQGTAPTVIAIIDSGIDWAHPDLSGKRWINSSDQVNGQDDDRDGFVDDTHGWDFVTESRRERDELGHGTAVAGLIVAQGNNSTGITESRRHPVLMSLRVLDGTGTGDVSRAVEAIDYAVAHGAQVINLSWGTNGVSLSLRAAIQRAAGRGVVVVTSAGNSSRDIESAPRYPASFDLPNIIAVASVDNSDQLSSWSNWGGTHVAVAAPGVGVSSTKAGGGYQAASGTSLSAAIVSGVAGLIKTLRPQLSAERTREMIMRGVRPVAGLQNRVAAGGVVNASGALNIVNTLPLDEGVGNSNGNTEAGSGNNGNGNSSRNAGADRGIPDNLRVGNGDEFRVTPPEPKRGAPGPNLPNLDEMRRRRHQPPHAPPAVPSTKCSPRIRNCNVIPPFPAAPPPQRKSIGTISAQPQSSPISLLASNINVFPAIESLIGLDTNAVSDSPFVIALSPHIRTRAMLEPAMLQSGRTNYALASNGAVASASSLYTDYPGNSAYGNYPASATINGDRKGLNVGTDSGWADGTPNDYPDWLEVNFNGSKTIDEIDIFSYQDDYTNPVEPTESMTFNSYGIVNFEVQYWNGSSWATVPGGSVTNNNKVWRKLTFSAITTNKIRVMVSYALNTWSRIVEVEAHGVAVPPPPARVNFARAAGATASASSEYGSGTGPAGAINGDRKGLNWGAGGGWADGTPYIFGDWLQVDFGGSKTINEIDVFTLQDDYSNPIEPTETTTFSTYGLINFDVQYLVGSTWVTVPGGSVTSNNKVWRKFTFSDITTSKIRVVGNYSSTYYSRITEVEAYGVADGTPANQSPVANLGGPYAATTLGNSIQFNGSASSDPDGTIASYSWNFGDNTTSALAQPQHTYTAAGTYTVTLTVTDNSGAQSSPVTTSVSIVDSSMARLDPNNATGSGGVDLLSRNANWSLPILGLKGRAGLDLGLSLSYNSLVWTRDVTSNSITFDADRGMPGPGFRLGFPVIQPRYYNSQVGVNAYLLITPSGSHTELRQVGTSNIYESADSSYLQLIDNGGGSLRLRPTDGSQLFYTLLNGQYQCTQIEDRNGNFITISYFTDGRINTVTDTLARVITFNYDAYLNLNSITQTRGGATHQWATFGWGNQTISTGFSGLTVIGPQNGTIIPVLTQIAFANGTRYNFEYNSYAQVAVVRHYAADNHQLSYTSYTLPASSSDCPRVSEQHDWAENWNNNLEAVTTYSTAVDYSSGQLTAPDGTTYKELYYTTGWQRGLAMGTEFWSGAVKKKWTTTAYTQDATNISYRKNPRVTETNIYDVEGNRKRTTIQYGDYGVYGLPYLVTEYAADATTEIRHNYIDYNLSQAYLDRHIIGLVSAIHISDSTWKSKVAYSYDAGGDQLQATAAAPPQHDAAYGTGFIAGRGNLTAISRFDVTDINNDTKALTTRIGYDTDGSILFTRDPLGHQSNLSYADSFSDGNNSRHTFAYPTTVTDADSFSSSTQYNYDFGAPTRTQSPAPAGQSQGAIQSFEYDAAGRISRVNNVNNSAYRRWVYDPFGYVSIFDTIESGAAEAYSTVVYDGAGRVRATGGDNPNSVGGYRGQFTLYDVMGRVSQTTNPEEINGNWAPVGDDAAGGWVSSQQTYDWKGRPRVTINADGTTREASYGGCGCAGGEVVTRRDEVGRRQRMTTDVLGRTVKAEVLDASGQVYSTTVTTYNGLDQTTNVREYQGAETSGIYQESLMSYDGYGRVSSRKLPQQTSPSVYSYYGDDQVQSVTDARGAAATYSYNNRHLVTGVSYSAPAGITATAAVSYSYDGVGNRTSMTDGMGSASYAYDQLSRMNSETRTFNGVGSFSLNYGYNLAGQLASMTDHFGSTVNYNYDSTGRLSAMTGAGAGVSSFVSQIQYRAWGAPRQISYGNGLGVNLSYNHRMQVTRFENPSGMGNVYDYGADGSLRYSQDLQDSRFDRSFAYDHVGRIAVANSGAEARGQATADGPYQQTYGYDVWGNLTSRSSRHWSRSDAMSAGYDLNNRQVGWDYDGDGRVRGYSEDQQSRAYRYDAAGRTWEMKDTVRIGATVERETTVTRGFDGDGELVKDATNYYCRTCLAAPNTLNYYVRSSVLGGKIAMTVKGNGQKLYGYVYANGELVATQTEGFYGRVWTWQQSLPSGTTNWVENTNYGSTGAIFRTELDAVGADVKTSDPYPPEGGDDPNSGLVNEDLMSRHGDATDLVGGCYVDHIGVPCNLMMMYINHGRGGQAGGGILGWVNLWEDVDSAPGKDDDETVRVNHAERNVGYPIWIPLSTRMAPQNREFNEAVTAARQILQGDNDCSRFFGGAGLAALNGIADAVSASGDGAFQAFPNNSSTGIRMDIPGQMSPSDAPVTATDIYAAISPTRVRINTNGAFVRRMSIGSGQLPRFGGYGPGTLQSRVLQLLHETGHLVVTDVTSTFRGRRIGNQTSISRNSILTHLLPLDSGNNPLSERNTSRVLDACRQQIEALRR